MKRASAILFTVLIFCLCTSIQGQDASTGLTQCRKKLDSLWNEFKKAKQDTTQCNIYLEIGLLLENKNPDTALYYYNQSLLLAESKSLKKQEASSLRNIGMVMYYQGNYTKSIDYFFKALKIFEDIDEKKGISACYTNIGSIHQEHGSYDKAIEYYLKSLKILEESRNKKGMTTCYNNIGNVHQVQGNYDKAIEYYLKSLKISEELADKTGMSLCFNNIGAVYYQQGCLDKASEYFFKALKIFEILGDKKRVSKCYSNIGGVYYMQGSLLNSKGNKTQAKLDYDKAIKYYLMAFKVLEELGYQKKMAGCYSNIGLVYADQGSFNKALEYYLKSLKINEELQDKEGIALVYCNLAGLQIVLADTATQQGVGKRASHLKAALEYGNKSYDLAINIGTVPLQNDAAAHLYKAYSKLGRYKEAIKFAEIFIATQDSMFSEEKTKALAKMQAQYEAEKRDLTIQKLEKEKLLQDETIARKEAESKKQRILIFSFLAGFIIILVFSVFLYRMFLQKKKANRIIAKKNQSLEIAFAEINHQKEEITAQRDEIEAQRDKLSEQNHILFEQKKEITDSINYARRIQQAVLPDIAVIASGSEAISPSKKIASSFVLAMTQPEAFVLFKPKDIVSGDFYWATRINDWLIVTVADCTGHGVPGAFMSMLGVSFLNEIVRKKEITKASEVLDHLRESIIEALQQKGAVEEQKDGMDIALCAINSGTNHLQFAGANNPLYLVKNVSPLQEVKHLNEIKGDKQPVAIYEKMTPFTNHELQLQKGDTLYLCSDGYEDQFGGQNNKKFKIKQLKELFVNIADKKNGRTKKYS